MLHGCRKLCASGLRLSASSRCAGTMSRTAARKRRSQLFDEEKRRQRSELGRIEKIEVQYKSVEDEVVLMMNRNISTPYDCAMHISESVAKTSAIAILNHNMWDMHRPLPLDCNLEMVTLKSPRKSAVNNAFWRTCSFILGAVAENSFKDHIDVHLHSFPIPVIRSGSFTYDVFVDLPNWQPNESELRAMSALFVKLANSELPLETLNVPCGVALHMFKDNPFKSQQIPNIAKRNYDDTVSLYRLGDHVDISKGPMVGNSGLIGRVTISAVHKLVDGPVDGLYRFQGIALPKGILLNHFAYSKLEDRARKLNTVRLQPYIEEEMTEEVTDITASVN